MLRIWLMAALLVAVVLSGCTSAPDDEGDDGRDDTDGDVGFGFDGDGNLTGNASMNGTTVVSWVDYPAEANGTEPLMVTWSVDTANANASADGNSSAGNASAEADTNDTVEETGVAYGSMSVLSPVGPEDYENTTGVENDTTSGEFSAEIPSEGANGTIYVRAYALFGGQYHWSEEIEINATGNASEGVQHEIVIQAGSVPLGQFDEFDTEEITIKLGDSVVWNNTSPRAHTVSVTGPQGFDQDTGSIASGSASQPMVFVVAGEYEYELDGGSSSTGTITVEE